MRIPNAHIEEFQRLYKVAFGIDIDSEEAHKQGLAVMRLVAIRQEQELLDSEENKCNLTPQKEKEETKCLEK